ncbi:prephenate dehydratase [Fundicoccus culcitae]|uniref:Prephenate dehydratase n=1 Tax=Fundicoccus culcitae TaxID=2969821 RepID=A0ABY5P601_9LACT|nr:prephenate dehydratase domain-containing protein [Fundicoccus culcitae]UUX34178.1 prephenate dehydratase [Fundicoccus culcitae]
MRIGYQGVPGAYSEMALQKYFSEIASNQIEAIEYDKFSTLIQAVANKALDYAVVPIENSTTGLISRTMDLFRYQPITAVGELLQPVQHVLWGIKGSQVEQLKVVYSHPEALAQSQNFFEQHPFISSQAFEDTAKAAQWVAQQNDPTIAALASQRAGELYDLIPLKEAIQTEQTNTTRFFIIRHQEFANQDGNRLIAYFETRHQPGALLKILQTFDLFNCNLEGLNARPIPGQPFSYGFFIEVNIEHAKASLSLLKEVLNQAAEYVQLIGRFD